MVRINEKRDLEYFKPLINKEEYRLYNYLQ